MASKKQKSLTNIFLIIMNTTFYIIIITLVLFSIANIQVKRNDDIPHLFGTGFYAVLSDSMEGNNPDSFNKGDLIIVKMVTDEMLASLQVGDVVTYFDYNIRALNTHRIIEMGEFDGIPYVITQGDNPLTPTGSATGPDNPILLTDVKAIHHSTIPNLGNTLVRLQSPTGFALFVILPVFLILIYQGVVLGRNYLALSKSKLEEKMAIEKEQAKLDLAAQKELMKKELLEELKKEQSKS
jgi:signal peptidase I